MTFFLRACMRGRILMRAQIFCYRGVALVPSEICRSKGLAMDG